MQYDKIKSDDVSLKNFIFENNPYYDDEVKDSVLIKKESKSIIEDRAFNYVKKYDRELNSKTEKNTDWILKNYEKVNNWIFKEHKKSYCKNIKKIMDKAKELNNSELNNMLEAVCENGAISEIEYYEKFVNEEFNGKRNTFDMDKQAELYRFYYEGIVQVYEGFYRSSKLAIEAHFIESLKIKDIEAIRKVVIDAQNDVKALNIVVCAIVEYSAIIVAAKFNAEDMLNQ